MAEMKSPFLNREERPLAESLISSVRAHAPLIATGVAAIVILTILHHFLLPRYTANAVLVVQRAQNSPLQATMGKLTGSPLASRNEYLDKYRNYLNSHEFFLVAARKKISDTQGSSNQDSRSSIRKFLSNTMSFIRGLFYVKLVDPETQANVVEQTALALNSGARFIKAGSDNIEARVTSRNYVDAVNTANFLARVAVETITQRDIRELKQAREFIVQEQLAATKRLGDIDSAVVDFRRQTKLVQVDEKGKAILESVARLKTNLENNQLQLEHNRKLITALNKELKSLENQILTEGARSLKSSAVLTQLRKKMDALRYQRMLLQAQGLSADSRQIVDTEKKIDQLALRIKEQTQAMGGTEEDVISLIGTDKDGLIRKLTTLQRENQYLETSVATLEKALLQATEPLAELPAAQQKIFGFNRAQRAEFEIIKEMKKKILEIELERIAVLNKIRLLEKATIAGIPARYSVLPKMIFASIIGFLLCSGLAFATDELSRTISAKGQLREAGLIPVGSIPKVRNSQGLAGFGKTNENYSIEAWRSGEETPEILAVKHLRAMLTRMRLPDGQQAKVACVLGATAGDGKSFVTLNLGLALAQWGKKTLILDGDLRRPTLAKRLNIPANPGMSSILSGTHSVQECVQKNVFPNLDAIPSGPFSRTPTELLGQSAIEKFIRSLREQYEYIVIDTPPILPIVDSLTIAAASDIVFLAVSHRKTKLSNLRQAVETFEQFDGRPLYAIYNRSEGSTEYTYSSNHKAGSNHFTKPGKGLEQDLANFRASQRQNEGETHVP